MRGVTVHGVLLVVALVLAYWAWTGDEPSRTDRDEFTVWRGSSENVVSVRYEREDQILEIERRQADGAAYLWGTVRRVHPGPDSVSGTGVGTVIEKAQEFPVGERGEELLAQLAPLTALRDLGGLNDSLRLAYELVEPERRLRVTFENRTRELLIGGSVFGGGHRYALDVETDRGYVISSSVLQRLDGGQGGLRLTGLHEFEWQDVGAVTVRSARAEQRWERGDSSDARPGGATWTSAGASEPDQTFANFMDRIQRLAVIAYDSDSVADSLELRVRIDYLDAEDRPLGFVELYRQRTDRVEAFEYYLRTELTRILARAHPSIGERVDEDLGEIF
jgi:hypothetical protein